MADVIPFGSARPGTPEPPRYNPEHYYSEGAYDKRGHAADLRAKVQPELCRWMDELIASKEVPYHTKGELVRNAVWHECHYQAELVSDDLKKQFRIIEALANAKAFLEFGENQERLYEECKKSVEQARKLGMQQRAEVMIRGSAEVIVIPKLKKMCLDLLNEL